MIVKESDIQTAIDAIALMVRGIPGQEVSAAMKARIMAGVACKLSSVTPVHSTEQETFVLEFNDWAEGKFKLSMAEEVKS